MDTATQKITPNLWFDTEAEAAANFYVSAFDDAAIGDVSTYDEASAEVSGQPVGSTLTVTFELAGTQFVALNGGPQFTFTPAISFMVNCPTAAAVDELWDALSDEPLMPLDSYPFSDRYGWTEDVYGLSWQLIHRADASERSIVPSLMFVGEQCGRAEEAIAFYTSVFDGSAVGDIARYGPDQPPDEAGTVMFADVTLAGQRFAAMDSAQDHDFAFNEAVSFSVDCADQDEVDRLWATLTSAGGSPGQCGWLTDRFGVSWQVVPSVLPELLADADEARASRVMEAMLRMGKLDVGALIAAAED